MQIIQVQVTRKKNLGNYETADLSVTAQLDEKDSPDKTVEDLAFYVDYKLNESERETKLAKIQGEINSGKLSDVEVAKRENWIELYNKAAERFNKLEFK